MLSSEELIVIGVVMGALLLIISNRLRPDLVAMMVLLVLAFTKVVTPEEALSGFSRPAVVTIIGLFIITEALDDTGIIRWIAKRINSIGHGSETRLVLIFMLAGAGLSLMMNNIAAGAVLLPAALRIGRASNVRLSKLLIPLSFGTLVGGMATYLTTANIIMSGILESQGFHGLSMMDFIPTGGFIVATSVVYMLLVGRRLLPNRDSASQSATSINLYETYQLDQRLWEVHVKPGSQLANTQLCYSGIGEKLGLALVGIWRGHRAILSPEPTQMIKPGDYLLVMGREERVEQLTEWGVSFRRENYTTRNGTHNYDVELTEVLIPPRSNVTGTTLIDMNFRVKYGLTCVALWREGRSYRTDVGKMPLQVGDALLMVGPPDRIRSLARERDFLVMHTTLYQQPNKPEKAAWALGITALVLGIAIFDLLPLAELMLAGAVALIITGCLNMDEAYRAIEWQVVFLIAGMLPISIAMRNTGLAEHIGTELVNAMKGSSPLVLIGGLFTLATAVTQLIGGQVTALIVGPIAISTAIEVGVNPQAAAVAVAIGCSTAFLTPIAHPVNILMMGPGGYTFGDFFKVGLGMTIVAFATLMAGMLLFWEIH